MSIVRSRKRSGGGFGRKPIEYRERDDSLRRLGFGDYRAYLKSDLWAGIRERVMRAAGGKCKCCQRPASAVHHSRYDYNVMRGDTIVGLYAVCDSCHKKCGHASGQVRDLSKKPPKKKKRKQSPWGGLAKADRRRLYTEVQAMSLSQLEAIITATPTDMPSKFQRHVAFMKRAEITNRQKRESQALDAEFRQIVS